MVNSYHKYKVESLKAKRCTLQSPDPMHPSKERVNYHHNFSQTFMLRDLSEISRGGGGVGSEIR